LLKNEDFQEIHKKLAQLASENWINLQGLVPSCSSFVIEAKKA
jgi:hypothetical protein